MKKIRLTEKEIKAIKETALEIFGRDTKVYIFGSRTNPSKKGGDIDIFLEIPDCDNLTLVKKRLKFLVRLKDKIGEQKIDLLIKREKDSLNPIYENIKKCAVRI